MATLRISNIEAKAAASSPSIDEKVTFKRSTGQNSVVINAKQVGVSSVGINSDNPRSALDIVGDVNVTGSINATGGSTVSVATSITSQLVAHNTTFASIGLSTTITPSATSKRVYIDVSVPVYMNKGASVDFQQMEIDLRRNGNSLIIQQTGLYVGTVIGRQDYGTTVSFNYVDSPSTVGITTYEVFAKSINTTTNYWTSAKVDFSNTGSIIVAPSHITLMEVN